MLGECCHSAYANSVLNRKVLIWQFQAIISHHGIIDVHFFPLLESSIKVKVHSFVKTRFHAHERKDSLLL